MYLYIVGISKQDPNDSRSTVRARAYQAKPAEGNAPRTNFGAEFNFQVEEADAAAWTAKIGTYAEVTIQSFT